MKRLTHLGILGITAVLAALVVAPGCVANAICSKLQECDDHRSSDDVGVCVESYNANINSLRANKEKECLALADAEIAFDGCRSQLDCGIFQENDLAGRCDKEKRDLDHAEQDINGVNCTSLD